MGLPRRKKTRLKMLMMIASSSIMVASLATATMAWYSVSVNISVSSSTITIRTPFQYYFYAYNENGFSIKTSGGETVKNPASTDVFTQGNGYKTVANGADLYTMENGVPKYYTEVDALRYLGISSDQQAASAKQTEFVNALTEVSGLWPGYKMSFAIKATGLAADDLPQLKVTRVTTSGSITVDGKTITRKCGSKIIYLAQAMTISAGVGTTLENAVKNASNKAIASRSAEVNWWEQLPLNLGGPTSFSATCWYFWTIEFSNAPTTWYTRNSNDDSSGVEQYTASDSGDSNAYQGLEFKIETMTLQNN